MDWFLLNKGEIHIRIRKTLFVYDLNQCVFSTIEWNDRILVKMRRLQLLKI